MIRWICGAKLADEIPSAVLHQKLDLDEITAVLRTRRLRWNGHVQRATSCINSITRLELPGTRDCGRPRKTWSACVRWYDYMQPGWCQPVRQEFMENECEALPGVAYPGVRDNRSTLNTKTGYDQFSCLSYLWSSTCYSYLTHITHIKPQAFLLSPPQWKTQSPPPTTTLYSVCNTLIMYQVQRTLYMPTVQRPPVQDDFFYAEPIFEHTQAYNCTTCSLQFCDTVIHSWEGSTSADSAFSW